MIRELRLRAATDVTGFGLGGHLLEMAAGSGVAVELRLADVPFLPRAVELAGLGMLPAGSFANRAYCAKTVSVAEGLDPIRSDLVFDAQTSGGMVLAVPEEKVPAAQTMLRDAGDLAAIIGCVVEEEPGKARLRLV